MLLFLRFGVSAEQIEDLDLKESSFDTDDTTQVNSVSIIAVSNLETTYNCIIAGRIYLATQKQKSYSAIIAKQNKSSRAIKPKLGCSSKTILGKDTLWRHTMTSIVPTTDTITDDDLLNAPSFNITFDQYNTIISVSRQ